MLRLSWVHGVSYLRALSSANVRFSGFRAPEEPPFRWLKYVYIPFSRVGVSHHTVSRCPVYLRWGQKVVSTVRPHQSCRLATVVWGGETPL